MKKLPVDITFIGSSISGKRDIPPPKNTEDSMFLSDEKRNPEIWKATLGP